MGLLHAKHVLWALGVIMQIKGAEDLTTPSILARRYFDSIKAPRKAFVSIRDGGHFAVFMKSELFLQELVARVRPLGTRP